MSDGSLCRLGPLQATAVNESLQASVSVESAGHVTALGSPFVTPPPPPPPPVRPDLNGAECSAPELPACMLLTLCFDSSGLFLTPSPSPSTTACCRLNVSPLSLPGFSPSVAHQREMGARGVREGNLTLMSFSCSLLLAFFLFSLSLLLSLYLSLFLPPLLLSSCVCFVCDQCH